MQTKRQIFVLLKQELKHSIPTEKKPENLWSLWIDWYKTYKKENKCFRTYLLRMVVGPEIAFKVLTENKGKSLQNNLNWDHSIMNEKF